MNVIATSRLCENFQTIIPDEILDEFKDLNTEDIIIEWSINDNDEIIVKLRKKRDSE